jgi:ketol-acid reductoisomerase
VELIKAGYETLTDAGYAPEMAYFECLHEVKLIVDLIFEGGIANMNYSISNNAEFGEYVTGPKVIGDEARAAMKQALRAFSKASTPRKFILEGRTNYPEMTARRRLTAEHIRSRVGEQLRAMMPWIKKNKWLISLKTRFIGKIRKEKSTAMLCFFLLWFGESDKHLIYRLQSTTQQRL